MPTAALAIIGGTGLTSMHGLRITAEERVDTPYGQPSAPLVYGRLNESDVVFLTRHGPAHTIPPHRINYRANIWALKACGVQKVIAVAAVGAIRSELDSGCLVIPDQLIDYTYGRDQTFFSENLTEVIHVDFGDPYCPELREILIRAADEAGQNVCGSATYAAAQGPRLETVAEIDRMEKDGCDVVGMTGMPEAVLARELSLCYAACAVVANPAAGRGRGPIEMKEIKANVHQGLERFQNVLDYALPMLKRSLHPNVSQEVRP